MTARMRILVTGGGTFIGDQIALALLDEGAEVTLLVRPGAEDRLGELGQRVRWWTADVWEPSSLKGRARGHQLAIHTVGGLVAAPTQGLTHHWLNFVSARNVANLCVSSGVPRMLLLSSAAAPWLSREYLKSKREAELYLDRVGLRGVIVRAPLVYARGTRRNPFFALLSALGGLPPLSWLGLRRIAPLPVDVAARGIARLALDPTPTPRRIYYAGDLRRLNSRRELRHGLASAPPPDASAFFAPMPPPNVPPEADAFDYLNDTSPMTPPRL